MCFQITNNKPLKKVVGWKVVSTTRKPPYYPDGRLTYKLGSVVKMVRQNGARVVNTIGDDSEAGIYVFLSREAARNELKYWNGPYGTTDGFKVIKLGLDPKDFIASGRDTDGLGVATYRKVTVLS